VGVDGTRRELVSTRAGDHQCTLAYVNQVGAQDGLIFDGGGFVNQNGRMAFELPRFEQTWGSVVVDLERTLRPAHREHHLARRPEGLRRASADGAHSAGQRVLDAPKNAHVPGAEVAELLSARRGP
jgi:NAD+ synthase (glutamine-hydrolysing)